MTTIAVAGATGTVGRYIVEALRSRRVNVVPIARSRGVDLITGNGVHGALYGVSAVIDVSNVVTSRASTSIAFFHRATTNLLDACRQNRVERYVVLSIVGIDRLVSGYYAGKLVQERLVAASGLTTSIVRTTQFHEFASQTLERFSLGPVALVPNILSRPLAASAVADRLARVALSAQPPNRVEMAGPDCRYLPEMTRRLCEYRHERKLIIPVQVPGKVGRAMADGALLPTGPYEMDTQSFDDWLESQPRGHMCGDACPAAEVSPDPHSPE